MKHHGALSCFSDKAKVRAAVLLLALTHNSIRLSGDTVACQVTSNLWGELPVYQLQNGLVSLWVVPDLGGLVVQCQLDGHSFFSGAPTSLPPIDTNNQTAYRTNAWPTNRGDQLGFSLMGQEVETQEPSSEKPLPDQGKCQVHILEQSPSLAALTVTNPKDPRTGIQLKRTISLYAGGTQMRLDCWMKNTGNRIRRWSLHTRTDFDTTKTSEPTSTNCDLFAFASLRPGLAPEEAWSILPAPDSDFPLQIDTSQGLLKVKFEPRPVRVGLMATEGWLAVMDTSSQFSFVQHFTAVTGARYPDRLPAAFRFNGPGDLVLNEQTNRNLADDLPGSASLETQIFSPLVALDPGQDYHFQVDWYATRCPVPLAGFTSAGLIHRPVRLSPNEQSFLISGILGVFFQGRLEAIVKGKDGSILARENLGEADPRHPCILDQILDLPAAARKLHLILLDQDETHRGTLAELDIPNR